MTLTAQKVEHGQRKGLQTSTNFQQLLVEKNPHLSIVHSNDDVMAGQTVQQQKHRKRLKRIKSAIKPAAEQ